jgi:hypothetical protein
MKLRCYVLLYKISNMVIQTGPILVPTIKLKSVANSLMGESTHTFILFFIYYAIFGTILHATMMISCLVTATHKLGLALVWFGS